MSTKVVLDTTENEFVMHGAPHCLDNQREKLQGVGLRGVRVESLPRKVTISPREPVFLGREPSGTGAICNLRSICNQIWEVILVPINRMNLLILTSNLQQSSQSRAQYVRCKFERGLLQYILRGRRESQVIDSSQPRTLTDLIRDVILVPINRMQLLISMPVCNNQPT